MSRKTVAIIGGGCSGTLLAVNLARLSEAPLNVVLINRGKPIGRGVAYATKQPEHLLNVAARNMSGLADHPNHFLDWLKTRSDFTDVPEATLRETFVPRRVYGDYLRGLLQTYAHPVHGSAHGQIEFVQDEAVDVEWSYAGVAVVRMANSDPAQADRVVLATGNEPPAAIGGNDPAFLSHPAYVANPWSDWASALPNPSEDVVLLGTGLTMVDAFLTLYERNWTGTIYAVSRNGRLPESHFRGIEYADFPPSQPEMLGLDALVELLENHCDRLRAMDANPAIVVDKLRPHTQRIWQRLTMAEKQTFLSRYAPRWNVLRHRIAPEIHQRLSTAVRDGRVQVVRANVMGIEAAGARVRVILDEDSGRRVEMESRLVVNCTGPNMRFSQCAPSIYQRLFERGLIAFDEMDMGVRVNPELAIIDRQGVPSQILSAMGPPLRGTLWETIAVPELRVQALQIARRLIEELSLVSSSMPRWPDLAPAQTLEYYI